MDYFKQTKFFLENKALESDYSTLVDLLNFHERKYYIDNEPIVSDYDYDLLFKQLEALETNNPSIRQLDSPTQRVSNDLERGVEPVSHNALMLSLGNSYNEEDLLDFDKQIKKLTNESGNIEYHIEPKYDGGSIAIVYENDFLVRAATRGNGVQGEEMTPNAKTMSTLPLKANFSDYGIQKAELRAEAIISKQQFERINQKRAEDQKELFANPRNAATGGLRTKDPNETKSRHIEAIIFEMTFAIDHNGNNILDTFQGQDFILGMLKKLGFKTPNLLSSKKDSIEEVIDFVVDAETKREDNPYELDGMVVKVNNLILRKLCGVTQHHPKWAIAYKFKAKQAITILENVEYQVGKVGSITPVAKVAPVQLAGVTISSISMHNADFISDKDLRIGDKIVIERAGDVIPYIVKPLVDQRTGLEEKIVFPTHCPVNHSDHPVLLKREENESAWRCPDCQCGLQNIKRIIFHVSKDAMDIDGFGSAYVELFWEKGWITDVSNIYDLPYDKIESLDGFGKKSVDKLKKSIEKAKSNPIWRLLHSLGVHHLGKKGSQLIAQDIQHVMDLKNRTQESLEEMRDIGPVLAKNIVEYFANPANVELLERLENYGVNLSQTEEDAPLEISEDAPLIGSTILFTGSLQKMTRGEAKKMATLAGAKNISAVSKNLNILVVGEKAGSKLKKAQELGTVKILSEEDFLSLID